MSQTVKTRAVCLLVLALGTGRAAAVEVPAKTKLDQSVDRALEFLQRTQDVEGFWRAEAGRPSPAVTALAVMAFLSAGHVPGEGPYGNTVDKGVRAVLKMQLPNGKIATAGGHEMYHHGICTLMLAEVAGMTSSPLADEVRKKLEKAVHVVLQAQRPPAVGYPHRGGWRYQVNATDSDLSVTGWQLMALRAAKNLGCDVPPDRIEQAIDYVKRCQNRATGDFNYWPNHRPSNACTATGILALEICGKDQHRSQETLKAGAAILRDPPRWGQRHFFYSVYYCSQAMFQLGDEPYWKFYQPKLHDSLLPYQRDNGSWLSGGYDSSGTYGPNYCTAMAVLALTVEYRLLPIYQRGEEPAAATKKAK